jgi:Glycerol-3-phosphate O-acyltransferase
MFDFEKYKDIAPYDEANCIEAVKRLGQHPEVIYAILQTLVAGDSPEAVAEKKKLTGEVMKTLMTVRSYDDFQKKITAGFFIPFVLEKSANKFSVSQVKALDKDKPYLFISNHRDIILDCALLDYALLNEGLPICEMAIGDNLLTNQLVEDLFRLNGGIIVKRTLPMREKYLESMRLSEYFVDKITEDHKSIWVAQKSGRSKDGLDNTHPSIIKMLYLSKRQSGISFPDLIKSVNIVPVSISYEFDPNDINKARELQSVEAQGKYEKKKLEDLLSMSKGLRGYKGNIHISLCAPLTEEYDSPDAVAAEIDRRMHKAYRLWPNNYFSYDYLEKTDRFKKEYENYDTQLFLRKYEHLTDEVRAKVLNSYANPVRSYLKACED